MEETVPLYRGGMVVLFDQASTQLLEGHTWSGEGGRGHSPSQPDQQEQTLAINGETDVTAAALRR